MRSETNAFSPEHALIFVMVMTSGVEGHLGDKELKAIGRIVKQLPAFSDFDTEKLTYVARECADILADTEGFETALGLINAALPVALKETAYALAVEIAASDLAVGREELRFLAILRDRLGLDKLVTAALERSAIARYRSVRQN